MDLHSHLTQLKVVLFFLPAAALCLGACAGQSAQAAAKTLLVEAGSHGRAHVPMSVEVPAGTAGAKMTDAGKDVPCQVAEGRLWWVLDELAAGATKTYAVEVGGAPSADKGVELKKLEDRIDIAIDGRPFTSYVFEPKPSDGHVLRRPYFYPVYGPGQLAMTRPFPMVTKDLPKNVATDHPHHTSIWVAHGDVNKVDNWSIGGKAGWQVHKGFEAVVSGPALGMFREALDWTDVDKKPNLAEVRTVRVYRLPDTARMIDLEIAFEAKYGPAVFGDTKEGGLCATRMRPEFRADAKGNEGRLINSEGQAAAAAWGKKATWVDCSGVVDGKRYGFAIFDAPTNLRHPQTWHARTYGLLTANPFGLKNFDKKAPEKGDWALEAGKSGAFRYRIYFHPGDEKEAQVGERCADYIDPPKAAWK